MIRAATGVAAAASHGPGTGATRSTRPVCGRAERHGVPDSLLPEDAPDWLTGEEWDACYFLGLDAFHRGGVECTVCEQVTVGMRRLAERGTPSSACAWRLSGVWSPIPRPPAPESTRRGVANSGMDPSTWSGGRESRGLASRQRAGDHHLMARRPGRTVRPHASAKRN